MRIAIVADSFPPLNNSAAVLVFSLAEALAGLGHQLMVITPSSDIEPSYIVDDYGPFKVLRIRCGRIKSCQIFLRGISEFSLFFTFPHKFKKTLYVRNHWDLVIWYSPSIFLSGLVRHLKKKSKNSYLILRDIVPDWMVDIGFMKKGPSYFLLKRFEKYQYKLADIIGVQSPGNKRYIEELNLPNLKVLEVLPNWMPSTSTAYHFSGADYSHADLQRTILAEKKVLIYAGNLGEAQGIENFTQLMFDMKDKLSLGFLVIGRGSKKEWLQEYVKTKQIHNVLILDEVNLITLSMYYSQCCAGLVFLDPAHQSHNIPGKFISYLEASLPVVACVNFNNDLIDIIKNNKLGLAADNVNQLSTELNRYVESIEGDKSYKSRARDFYEAHYQPNAIAKQIMSSISKVIN
ncbi:glycosyltransferase family 4 protein [Polynucleobacter paneuropaeus]|nr:glycosyltransferase family 4 protein [Polynucleobacter paneuropaeus]